MSLEWVAYACLKSGVKAVQWSVCVYYYMRQATR